MKHTVCYLLLILYVGFFTVDAQKLNVATYNIRNDNVGDEQKGNGWKQRCPVVCQLIQFHDFDIFGSQEVFKSQLDEMLNNLPEYNYIGIGRDDGKNKGEFSPIFYKRNMFKLLDSGTFWLSENTDIPNKGWDAALPRICTWGKFEIKSECKSFWIFNLHNDHIGVLARQESAKLILNKISSMCNGEPVILVGDFNVDQYNEAYMLLTNSSLLEDVYNIADVNYAWNGTFNNFDPNLVTEKRIDHIFVSNHFKVNRYGILTDTYRTVGDNQQIVHSSNFPSEATLKQSKARLPSDHFPVMVKLEIIGE